MLITTLRRRSFEMAKADKIGTFLGEGTEFEGKLKISGTLKIDGHFKGQISGAGTLIVGEGAKMIESDIHVSQILNRGEIQGNVIADEKIEIHAPGKVIGNIQTPVLVMDEGGIIEANCRVHKTEKKGEKRATVVNSDKSFTEF
jgi:cytoskeletal protein CcmA (bactofilin family)